MDNVLAIVPARGGSRGLERKNLRLLQGHPLLAYAVAAGRQARLVQRTLCSTEDIEIADIARQYGAEVPFIRPVELAQDHTPDLPVFQHALRWLEEHEKWQPEVIVQLRPTSPIRFQGQVDQAIELLLNHPNATGVRTVCPAPCNPYKMWRLSEDPRRGLQIMRNLLDVPGISDPYNRPRQELPTVWWQTGAIDVVWSSVILGGSMTGGTLLPFRTDSKYAIDIDSETGLRVAEAIMDGLDCIRPGPLLNWNRVRLLVLDVDGTLTPGTIYYGPHGEALKRFHTHDGQGIAMVRSVGVKVVILTSESTSFAPARARKLGVEEVHVGVENKLSVLQDICARLGVTFQDVAYIGDDVGDLPPMLAVARAGGIPCAVADPRPEVKSVARYQCPSRGGYGAVRDVCDLIVASKNS